MPSKVNIQPDVSFMSILPYVEYKAWAALAEFVDNALQSFLDNREELRRHHSNPKRPLTVTIKYDGDSITIRDDAAGIAEIDYERAFRPFAPPPDRTGLSEFGMGMKSAACWFAHEWSVESIAFGENKKRTVNFDVDKIVDEKTKELDVKEVTVKASDPYTKISLKRLRRPPATRTISKLKNHLGDIYRKFIREKQLILKFNGERLKYTSPNILKAPHHSSPDGEIHTWQKEISMDLGGGLSARGFAAILAKGDTKRAGFALFRRGRIIQGSGDEHYRPDVIFGSPTSFRYQRIFGELELEGFSVSHTKTGFQWDENEEPFIDLLKGELNAEELPLLDQAEGYRIKRNSSVEEQKWISTLPPETAKQAEAIIDISGNLPVEEERKLNSNLRKIIPSYPRYHWRSLHPKVQKASKLYYEKDLYYDACLAAIKEYMKELRALTKINRDHIEVIKLAFGNNPLLQFKSEFRDVSDYSVTSDTIDSLISAQRELGSGIWRGYRTPISHSSGSGDSHSSGSGEALKKRGLLSEQDCLDGLSIVSHLFYRLDQMELKPKS